MAKKNVLILRQGKIPNNKKTKTGKRKANFFLTVRETLTEQTAANAKARNVRVASLKDVPDALVSTTFKSKEAAIMAAEAEGFPVVAYQKLRTAA